MLTLAVRVVDQGARPQEKRVLLTGSMSTADLRHQSSIPNPATLTLPVTLTLTTCATP